MRKITKVILAFLFFIITVMSSIVAASYMRNIQEYVSGHLVTLYGSNPDLADKIYAWNKTIFNVAGFDKEARIKHVINENFKSVVLVNVAPKTGQQTMGGRGTGFFVSETETDATIITNYHVIESYVNNPTGYNLQVQAPLERWPYDVEIIGYDPVADIALLRIVKLEDEKFTPLEFADPKDIREGDPVVVIGHGMGLAWSSTAGQVVYDGRSGRPYNLMIQVDAVINQGNSGGPVFSMYGKVIGVAQSIYSPGRSVPGWDGVGLAVHARHAELVMKYFYTDAYQEEGYVPYSEYPFPVNSFTFEDIKDIPREDRYYVYADYTIGQELIDYAGIEAGIMQGDIIMEINEERVYSSFSLLKAVIYSRPGDVMKVKVLRNNPAEFEKHEVIVDVILGEIDYNTLMSYVNRSQGGR